MPTRTFMNVSKEKKIRILKAAKKEFSRVPLEKAVIANIVKDAKIPRGSFYQYFYSLDDLFVYLIEYLYGIDRRKYQEYLQESNNDIYEAYKLKFAHTIDRLAKSENRQFRINALATLFNTEYPKHEEVIKSLDQVDGVVNSGDMELFPTELAQTIPSKIINLIKMIGKSCAESFLSNAKDADKVKDEYNNYIDLIKTNFNQSSKSTN